MSDENSLANVHENLYDYLRTGESPSTIRSSNGRPEVQITTGPDIDLKELATHMRIRTVFSLGFGYVIQGFVNTPKDLAIISAMNGVGRIMGNEYIAYNRASETPVTDQFMAREIMGIDEVNTLYPDFNGTGITIGIADTGTDFGVTDLATAYDTEGGIPTSFDPGGTGLAITDFTLPARRRGGGAGDYLLTAGLNFTMWRGDDGVLRESSRYGVVLEDMLVGGYHGIVSQSGLYKVGMSMQNAAGLPGGFQFFIYILVDSTTAGVYDTLYIDFETSFAITAEYNGLSTWVTADWDFTNNEPHRWGDGTEVLASDFDLDGVNDFSMGMLSNTYDLAEVLTGELVSGILPDGSGFAVMNDPDGHGTGTAGSAAGRGLTSFDVYGNSTLYTVPGAAPGATIMALKLFTLGDMMNTWLWGCGYEPVSWVYADMGFFSNWTYTGDHKADIISNSWGFIDFELGYGPMAWGYDWYSNLVDFLSYWTDTLFCISTGNAGPGYGTSGSPYAVSAMMVGASTTSHWAQTIYGEYPQGYDTMADFSSNGPTPLGSGAPSVVAIGAYAFDVYALHYGAGNGLDAWTTFGGTSQASPLAAGVTAIVMQAMLYSGIPYSSVGLFSSMAKSIVMNGADDLGYDVYRQGAGRVNAWKSINLAFGNTTDGTDDLIALGTMETYDQIFAGDRQCGWRGWYINMYYGWEYGFNLFDYISFYHPGYEYGPDAGVYDGAAFPHPIYRGDARSFNVSAAVGTVGPSGVDAIDAYTYQFSKQASAKLVSTSTYTTFNLTKEFGSSFMSDFYAADYATIMLTYPRENLEDVYALSGQAPYVFLHDWMNDTNGNGIIDLTGFGVAGEVRRIASDTSYSNCHQINLGNPGSLFQKTPAIYYHDVGVEFFLWRTMDVNVTIRLYNREPWTWVSTTPVDAYNWTVTVTTPADATPGCYEGFLEADIGTGAAMMPLSVRVDAYLSAAGAAGALTWGSTQGTPYDNGATYGGLDYGGRQACGDWRFYFLDGFDDFTDLPSYLLVNVTWSDPNTRLDVYVFLSWYGYILAQSDFEFADGRWQGTSTWTKQNVLLVPVGFAGNSWFYLSGIGIAVRTGAFGGSTGGPENFWISVSYGYENHPDDLPTWGTPAAWMNVTNPASYGGQAIVDDATYTGPHVTFKGNWTQLAISEFPSIKIRETDLMLLKASVLTIHAMFTEANCTPNTATGGPYDAYWDFPDITAGALIEISLRVADPPGTPGVPPHDLELFLVNPSGVTVASSTNSGSVEDIEGFIAPAGGTYQIAVDYWGVDTGTYYYWGGWASNLPFTLTASASAINHNTQSGLAANADTWNLGLNAAIDVLLKGITGTDLDLSTIFEVKVTNVSVTNFFAPTVHLTAPNGGQVFDWTNPVTITWTATDRNHDEPPYDEALGFSVEVSNNSGTTWKTIVYGTTLNTATWNPSSAFYGLPPGTHFLVRVNVTDGMYTASDVSDATFTLTYTAPPPAPQWELYTVIIVAVVVVVILLATCLLKRRQTPAK